MKIEERHYWRQIVFVHFVHPSVFSEVFPFLMFVSGKKNEKNFSAITFCQDSKKEKKKKFLSKKEKKKKG